MAENNTINLAERLEEVDRQYREALKKFHEISDERNQLIRANLLPEYAKNIGKCYKRPRIVVDSDDELAHYRFVKITDAVYDGSDFMDMPKNVGIEFGLDLKGRMMFFPKEYVNITADCQEITEYEFKERFDEFIEKLNSFKI